MLRGSANRFCSCQTHALASATGIPNVCQRGKRTPVTFRRLQCHAGTFSVDLYRVLVRLFRRCFVRLRNGIAAMDRGIEYIGLQLLQERQCEESISFRDFE